MRFLGAFDLQQSRVYFQWMTAAGCTSECSLLKYDVMFIEHVRTIVPLRCSFLHHSSQRASESARTAHTHTHTHRRHARGAMRWTFSSPLRGAGHRLPLSNRQSSDWLSVCASRGVSSISLAYTYRRTHVVSRRSRSLFCLCVCVCVRACLFTGVVCALCARRCHTCARSVFESSRVVRRSIRDPRVWDIRFGLEVRACYCAECVCMGTIELERCVCLCVPVCEPNISQQRVPPLRHIYYFKTIRWAGFCSRASVRDPRAKCCVCVCVDAVQQDRSTHNLLISYAGSVQFGYYCLQICVCINGVHVSHGFERELKHLRSSASSIMDYRRRRMDAVPALLLPLLLLQLLFMIGGTDAYFDESEMRGKWVCCVWFISPVCVEIVKSMARLNHMCANRRWCRWYSVDRFLISRCESDLTPGAASRNPFIDVVLENFIQRCVYGAYLYQWTERVFAESWIPKHYF